ncbi:diguanylate cyclase [Anopheles sinensis]|uniref:Diguanylate cyclase n=1 Tax=Anopheles sinensis TaxID=74873 RepID=A0A084VW57_ANOSI|nr:diguanylate cyclase [Anopheles sinensis]
MSRRFVLDEIFPSDDRLKVNFKMQYYGARSFSSLRNRNRCRAVCCRRKTRPPRPTERPIGETRWHNKAQTPADTAQSLLALRVWPLRLTPLQGFTVTLLAAGCWLLLTCLVPCRTLRKGCA